jgi:hypothetical protein
MARAKPELRSCGIALGPVVASAARTLGNLLWNIPKTHVRNFMRQLDRLIDESTSRNHTYDDLLLAHKTALDPVYTHLRPRGGGCRRERNC